MTLKKYDTEILEGALKKDWWRVYKNLYDRPEPISFSELIRNPELEEALMRSIAGGNLQLLRLMLTKDREVTSRYPQLSDLKEVKKLPEDHIETWALSAALRSQQSINNAIREEIELDPHKDFSGFLERAFSYPKVHPEFVWILAECITTVLTLSSLLGLEKTIASLRKEDPELYGDSIAALTSVPDYLERAQAVWRKGLAGHDVLQYALEVARQKGFPLESIAWLEERLREPVPSGESEDDEEFPF